MEIEGKIERLKHKYRPNLEMLTREWRGRGRGGEEGHRGRVSWAKRVTGESNRRSGS